MLRPAPVLVDVVCAAGRVREHGQQQRARARVDHAEPPAEVREVAEKPLRLAQQQAPAACDRRPVRRVGVPGVRRHRQHDAVRAREDGGEQRVRRWRRTLARAAQVVAGERHPVALETHRLKRGDVAEAEVALEQRVVVFAQHRAGPGLPAARRPRRQRRQRLVTHGTTTCLFYSG